MISADLFTEIGQIDGFGGSVDVSVDGQVVATLTDGGTGFDFVTELGAGVASFVLSPTLPVPAGAAMELSFGEMAAYFAIVSDPLTLLGDANNDLLVSGLDLIAVQQNFGNADSNLPTDGLSPGDANDDGLVSGADLIAVPQNFGKALSPTPVPEPAAIVLLAALVGVGAAVRRRS